MNFAFIIDDYLPLSTRVGAKMFHELALEFQKLGHQVTVITPDTTITDRFEKDSIDGIEIWRFKSGKLKDVGKIQRAINETLLSFRAKQAIKHKSCSKNFDGIIYYSPSIFFSGLVSFLKKQNQCKSYLVLRDLFPQWVIDAKMIKQDSLIAKYFRFFERLSYKQASQIGLMSEKNIDVFQLHHKNYPVEVLRNWAALTPAVKTRDFREELNLKDKCIFFYGGNIGHAQDMSNLMRLAQKMQSCPNAHFLFVGQGDEVELINKLAKDWSLSNFTYLPPISQQEFKQFLSEIDIGLFSLSQLHTAHNFPGKLLGYMVESKPILGSVNSGNDLLTLVNSNKAGKIFINGDDEQLFNAAKILYHDVNYRKQLGENANKLLYNEFSVHSAAKNILRHWNKL